MTLLTAFKEIIDHAPLETIESLNAKPYLYKDEYNHVNGDRCGLRLSADGHDIFIKLNLKDQTTVVREILPVRSQSVHVPIPVSDLTPNEITLFKEKVSQWVLQ